MVHIFVHTNVIILLFTIYIYIYHIFISFFLYTLLYMNVLDSGLWIQIKIYIHNTLYNKVKHNKQ